MAKPGAGAAASKSETTGPKQAWVANDNREGVLLRQGQQAAAAQLGIRAIAGVPLDELYATAVELVHKAMQADLVYVLQIEGDALVVRAHVGRTDIDPVGRVVDARNSIADYVIATGGPVITPDFALERRYTPPPAVSEVDARSAIAVPVQGRQGAFGSLVVMNRTTQLYQPEDIAFLQTAANVLAAAVDRAADSAALQRQQELFRAITEYGRDLVVILDGTGSVTYVSALGARLVGSSPEAIGGRHFAEFVHEDDLWVAREAIEGVMDTPNAMRSFMIRARKLNGEIFHVSGTAYNMLHHPAVQGIVINARDVTEMVQAQEALHSSQEQLHQALKMEAVGRLAGGIAHDFNNLLTAIRGYSDLLAGGLPTGDPRRHDVLEIQRAADRAAGLTHQLLAFSRRQVLRPDRLDLGLVVRDLESMVRRLIGEDIELSVISRATRIVLVDRGQIEQVLLNLVINARDAMPSGGRLVVETSDVDVTDQPTLRGGAPPPGRYALVKIRDYGVGIEPAILDRIYEPFFTTKGPGKGTGLGLSTAYGTVKQSGGFIQVESTEGMGTTFSIYLPQAAPAATVDRATNHADAPVPQRTGGETILLVEDADAVRVVVRRALGKMGYRVLEAANGPQAIGVALQYRDAIDLLLTDFVMPLMGGRELIDRVRELGLNPRVLIMSGYIDDALLRGGGLPADAAFIEKPFTAEGIGRKVREVLDRSSAVAR